MPTITTQQPFDVANAASKLPAPLQYPAGFAGGLLGSLLGGNDPSSMMNVGMPMMAGEGELTPLAKALYSRVQRVVDAMPDWLHPAKALSLLKNNASKEELDTRGLTQLLTERQGPAKISKAELQSHLAQNPVPDVRVKTLGTYDQPNPLPIGRNNEVQYNRPDLNIPGGKNYTESLFKLNRQEPPATAAELKDWYYKKYGGSPRFVEPENQPENWFEQRFKEDLPDSYEQFLQDRKGVPQPYEAPHFSGGDNKNLLLHTREDIRPDAKGVPGKFLQEIQSDWHQAGREQGYYGPVDRNKLLAELDVLKTERMNLHSKLTPLQVEERKLFEAGAPYSHIASQLDPLERRLDEVQRRIAELSQSTPDKGVPDAPFKDTWPDLALKKHVLDVANSPDQHWLGFTTGDTQNARYDLSKRVGMVEYQPGLNKLSLTSPDGNYLGHHYVSQQELPNWIGQENVDKLFHGNPENGSYFLGGLDLQTGGEGMRHYYDNLYPKRLEKILKPFGGKVEQGTLQGRTVKPNYLARFNPDVETHQIIGDKGIDPIASVWPPTKVDPGFQIVNLDLSKPEEVANFQKLREQALDGSNKAQALKAELIRRDTKREDIPFWQAHLTPEMKEAIKKAGLPLMSVLLSRQLANSQGQK